MSVAYIGLGGNIGEPEQAMADAVRAIEQLSGVSAIRVSSMYKSAPVDSSGPDYVNAVAEITCDTEPEALLTALLTIENQLGRVRPAGVHNAPRCIDCDLLLFGQQTRKTAFLMLPHPRMHQRAFVLLPLLELNPNIDIPGQGKAVEFLEKVRDQRIEHYKSARQWLK